jgi:hypothetical protein
MKDVKISDFMKPTVITAQQYGTRVSVEIDHSDTDISELFDAFKTICIGLGYSESSWKEYIVDTADEYKQDESENINDDDYSIWDSTLSDGLDEDEDDYNFILSVEPPNDNLKKAAEEFNKKITSFNKKVKKNKN